MLMFLSSRVDRWLTSLAFFKTAYLPEAIALRATMRFVNTSAGRIRVVDSGTPGPVIVIVPDGPNVVEHYQALVRILSVSCRVVCFDMPGFGFSLPSTHYTHSLEQGARTVLQVLDALQLPRAALAFSCANGFYALRAASLAPERITCLVLSQTPSLKAMHAWTGRVVPRPLRWPVLGQVLGWLARRKAVASWYRIALPNGTDDMPFYRMADHALRCGSCFGLAGVVQGLLRESDASLENLSTPCTVIWGAQDRSHRDTQANSLRNILPQTEFFHFDDCGHFPDLEKPQRYASVLMKAVARATSAESLTADNVNHRVDVTT